MQTAWIWMRLQGTRVLIQIQSVWQSDNIFFQLWATLKHFENWRIWERRGCTKGCFLVQAKPIHIFCVVSIRYCLFVIEKLALTGLRFGTYGALKVVWVTAYKSGTLDLFPENYRATKGYGNIFVLNMDPGSCCQSNQFVYFCQSNQFVYLLVSLCFAEKSDELKYKFVLIELFSSDCFPLFLTFLQVGWATVLSKLKK